MELTLAKRKWRFFADSESENQAWHSAIANRICMRAVCTVAALCCAVLPFAMLCCLC